MWQSSGLENGLSVAHIRGMAKDQNRLLEVKVAALRPKQWEWQVCEGNTPLAVGFETTRETAQIKGDSALFRLLATGLNK